MPNTLNVACVQMTSGPDIKENLERVSALIRGAVSTGAQFIVTPENTDYMRFCSKEKLASAYTQADHPGVAHFSALARKLNVTLLIGSMAVKPGEKLLNRSFLFNPEGDLTAHYDKIHLFEVKLPSGEAHREADIYEGGTRAVTAKISDDFILGLSICYDVRFPHLYRDLAKMGANILCVPAAFTVPTGQAHWETLLRARAIETGCYVIASGQCQEHEGGRKTHGHSMIITPWGEVLCDAGRDVGVVSATLDLGEITKARTAINALNHDKNYALG